MNISLQRMFPCLLLVAIAGGCATTRSNQLPEIRQTDSEQEKVAKMIEGLEKIVAEIDRQNAKPAKLPVSIPNNATTDNRRARDQQLLQSSRWHEERHREFNLRMQENVQNHQLMQNQFMQQNHLMQQQQMMTPPPGM